MTLPGLWVDDDEQFLADNIPLLEKRGLRIDRASSAAAALGILKRNPRGYAYLIVDLEMPDIDGVELIQRVRAIHPTIPIMLASAHTEEPVWAAKLESLGENLPSIPKIFPMVTSRKFGEIVGKIHHLGLRGVNEVVFKCPPKEFHCLDTSHRESLTSVARQINAPFVLDYFATHVETGWLVIGGEPGKVLASGLAGEVPANSELVALSYKHGFPVFLFLRNEYISLDEVSKSVGKPTEAVSLGQPVIDFRQGGAMPSASEIPVLYSQIRELVARSVQEPELRGEIDRKIQRLRVLQEAEADELERKFEERLLLRSGIGRAHLRWIKERLGNV